METVFTGHCLRDSVVGFSVDSLLGFRVIVLKYAGFSGIEEDGHISEIIFLRLPGPSNLKPQRFPAQRREAQGNSSFLQP